MATKQELESELRHARRTQEALERMLQDFRKDVREKAKEVADEQGWCEDGLNEVLTELGLEPWAFTWERTATLKVTYRWNGDEGDDPGVTACSPSYNEIEVVSVDLIEERDAKAVSE